MRSALAKYTATTAVAVAMTVVLSSGPCAAQGVASSDLAVAATREAVQREVRAFYRDLEAGDWAALLTHFWPAKITARWEPPIGSGSWTHRSAGALSQSGGSGGAGGRRADPCGRDGVRASRADVRVQGRWARVMVAHCDAHADELWLLDVNGRWKIVHLILGA